jgi:LCP family protein required for cell wall assembly
MKRIHWIQLGLILIFLFLATVVASIFAFNRPLGPSLKLDEPGTTVAQLPLVITPQPEGPTAVPEAERPAVSTPLSPIADTSGEPAPICGQAGQLNLLMLGQNPQEGSAPGADAIRLIVVDYDRPAIQVLAMPPNLEVELAGSEELEAATLSEAFGRVVSEYPTGDPDGAVYAIRSVAQALLDNFGYRTDNYLALDQSTFTKIIDAVGSIEVLVPKAVNGAPDGYAFYESGLQEMDGQLALDYVQILQPAGQPSDEWARFKRQNQVIKGIQKEILKPENWDQIPNLVNDFYDLLITDLSARQLLSFTCVLNATGVDTRLFAVTPEMVSPGPGDALLPNGAAIHELIAEFTEAN